MPAYLCTGRGRVGYRVQGAGCRVPAYLCTGRVRVGYRVQGVGAG